MAHEILVGVCILICCVPCLFLIGYFLIFMYESAIASVTTTYILCEMMTNNSHIVIHNKCPRPWYYSNYLETIEGMKTYATVSFAFFCIISVIIALTICCSSCVLSYSNSKRKNYDSVA